MTSLGGANHIRVHESGHAVVDHLLGLRVTEVRAHDAAGETWARFAPPTEAEPERSDYLWCRSVGALAGEAAEAHLLGRSSDGSAHDLELARHHARQFAGNVDATIADCRLVAERLVREHEAAIRSLADVLRVTWGRLADHELRAHLQRLAGEPLIEHRDPTAVRYESTIRRRELFEASLRPGMTDQERQAAWDAAERTVEAEARPSPLDGLRHPLRVTSIETTRGPR